jgi:8-amino-7-oxononanoate synthase
LSVLPANATVPPHAIAVTHADEPHPKRVNEFDRELTERLAALRDQGLYRELRRVDSPQTARIRIGGRTLLNFSSNDYLGLANEPELKTAAIRAVDRFGAGAGASRLVCGSLAPHHELDEALASFKGVEAALSFSTGYATALGTIVALLGRDDVVVIDKLVHACIVDAARLCGARLRVFAHNDLNELEDILKWARERNPRSRILVVTESVFSMDGDAAPLREIVALKQRHGAWLMVDEAHATGIYGPRRRGLAEAQGVSDQIEVQMGTLGKALGAAGGYICGSRTLIDYLVNRARSFIFSTAPPPAAAAAAAAGVHFVRSESGEARRTLLWDRVRELNSQLTTHNPELPGAIIPLLIGEETRALAVAAALLERDLLVPAIRYPTVARGQARLRLTLSAAHSAEDIQSLTAALASLQLVNRK